MRTHKRTRRHAHKLLRKHTHTYIHTRERKHKHTQICAHHKIHISTQTPHTDILLARIQSTHTQRTHSDLINADINMQYNSTLRGNGAGKLQTLTQTNAHT